MKKSLLLGIAISLALGVAACNLGNEGKDNEVKKEHNNEQKLEKQSKKEEQFIYGKVKSIIGNEIEFELASDPKKDIEGIEKKEQQKQEKKDEIPAATMTPAMNKEDGAKVSVGEIEKNEPLVELEFTGDLKTITIPSGIDINVLSARTETGLGSIKEGTYLRLSVDDNKSENPTILSVDVIS